MPRAKTVMVDLDGVICTEEQFHDRPLAEPITGAREALDKLRAAGYVIVIYTARGWGEYRVTKHWLDSHGFTYDGIQMGKPVADVWIDDRALRFQNWTETLDQLGLR
jgi:ribonucleotide monophosphatase NagD (HAD superfamily)